MHDDVLERTGKVGEQRGMVLCHFRHLNGQFVAVAVKVTVEPVASVEDEATGHICVRYIVSQFEAEAGTIRNTVPTLGNVDVRCVLDEVVAVGHVTL